MEDEEEEDDIGRKNIPNRGGFWRNMSLERVRDHPFIAALLLSILIRVVYRALVYFSPLIISTMLCVLAFIRMGPLLEQSREETSSKVHQELESFQQQQQQPDECHPWWKQLDGLNFVMASLKELYRLALENAEDAEMVKEISDKFKAIVVALQEFSSCLREIISDQAPPLLKNLPDKRTIVTKACQVGDMLGIDLNLPIRTIGTFIDEAVSEDPVNYVQEMDDRSLPPIEEEDEEVPSSLPELEEEDEVPSPVPLRAPRPPPPPPFIPEKEVNEGEVYHGHYSPSSDIPSAPSSSSGASSDGEEQDPYVPLFRSPSTSTHDSDVARSPTSPLVVAASWYEGSGPAVTMWHVPQRRKHFLSDVLLLASLLRATRRCFMACFRQRVPRR